MCLSKGRKEYSLFDCRSDIISLKSLDNYWKRSFGLSFRMRRGLLEFTHKRHHAQDRAWWGPSGGVRCTDNGIHAVTIGAFISLCAIIGNRSPGAPVSVQSQHDGARWEHQGSW
jgi:hypothetical protein